MKVQGKLRISIDVDGQLGMLKFRAVEEINHDIILGMDFGVECDLSIRLRAKQWKCGDHGEWHPFATHIEDSTPAIIAECAGLTEITPNEAERIKENVDRLVHKATTGYLPATHLTEHHIELTDYTPIRHAPRRHSPAMWSVAQEAVREMHQESLVERSTSAWCHAPVIQKKSDGRFRFCIDFRDLNARSKKDAYPIPNMDGILDKLRRAKYISIDLKNAYFQVELSEERILEVYGVTRVTTPLYHPQANLVERSNRTLKTMIATFVNSDHQSWDQHLYKL